MISLIAKKEYLSHEPTSDFPIPRRRQIIPWNPTSVVVKSEVKSRESHSFGNRQKLRIHFLNLWLLTYKTYRTVIRYLYVFRVYFFPRILILL